MLTIRSLEIYPRPPLRVTVFWKYGPEDLEGLDYRLELSRSYTPEMDEKVILKSDLTPNDNIFVDNSANYYSEKIYYYMLELFVNGESRQKVVSYSQPHTDRVVLTLIENEYLYLKNFVGTNILLFKRRKEGVRCTCYDPLRQQVTRSNCEYCFGTSYFKGFYGPFEMLMQLGVIPRDTPRILTGTTIVQGIIAWTIAYPQIEPGDAIVNPNDGNVFDVLKVNFTSWKGIPVQQAVELLRLDPSAPQYRLLKNIE